MPPKPTKKVVLTIAPTGSLPTKESNPNAPLVAKEIAKQAYECWQEGAAVAHFHARDEEGKPSSNVELFREIIAELDKYPDMNVIRQLSTGGRTGKTAQERGQMICLAPEMASLSTGSSNFAVGCNFNDGELISYLAGQMKEYKVKPEIEIFDAAMIPNALRLVENSEVAAPLHFNFVLGLRGSQPATPETLMFLYSQLPENCTWGVSVIGKDQVPLSTMALALGGNVRVGVEDNLYAEKGVLATNLGLLRRMKNIVLAMGKELATPDEAREILSIPKR